MSDLTTERLADNIRRAIGAAGLTQAEVAERAEIDPTALSKILSGKRRVSSLELALICTATKSDVLGLLEAEPIHGPSFRAGMEFQGPPERWSDGKRRERRIPAIGWVGARRAIVSVYGISVAHETETEADEWSVTVEGGWATMLDIAEAILAADRERRADLCRHCGQPPEPDGDHSCPCPKSDAECPDHPEGSR